MLLLRILLPTYIAAISFCARSSAENIDLEKNAVPGELNRKKFVNKLEAIHTFNGLKKFESIPILFPKDICLLKIEDIKFAACLHLNEEGKQYFVVFKLTNNEYIKIYEQSAPLAISMDCTPFENKGYIALANNLTKPVISVQNGSPLYQIYNNQVSSIQYFTTSNLSSAQFKTHGEELLLFQTISTAKQLSCPVYKWAGYHFNLLDEIPCSYTKKMEPFWIGSNSFLAVANYADLNGNTETFSEIYKFDNNRQRYSLFQKIKTSAAIDVKYFSVLVHSNKKHHFLVFANSRQGPSNNLSFEANSIVYKYENGKFMPFQQLLLYAVQQFLPTQNGFGKFIMLVACENQPTKLFQYDGWKFVESGVQLTEGALGKGVSKMRVFNDYNTTYIIIANENMLLNETNIYTPIYKTQETTKNIKLDLMRWTEEAYKNLSLHDLKKLEERIMNISMSGKKFLQTKNQTTFEYAEIKEVVTRLLKYPSKKMSLHFWKTIVLVKKVLDNFEERIKKIQQLQEKSTPFANESDLLQDAEHTFIDSRDQLSSGEYFETESLTVETLTVRDSLVANNINNQSREHIKVNKIDARKIILQGGNISSSQDDNDRQTVKSSDNKRAVTAPPNTYNTIKAEEVTVSGSINGIHIETIDIFALRKFGNQNINAPININNFKTREIITHGLINDNINMSKLVLVNEGNFVVNQDISFSQSIDANSVVVNDRINHIQVTNGKLDALLTKSNLPQIITGQKSYEAVTILEPITISGKILGSSWEKMSPITSIHEDIVLQGDYIITGNTTIKTHFSSEDIFGLSKTKSILKVINEGIEKQSSIPITLNFQSPIQVENAVVSFANDRDLTQFIKTNTDEVQMIPGHKIFTTDLMVHGLCEAAEINGINMDILEKSTLQKFGNQDFMGKVHFQKIVIPHISSDQIKIGENHVGSLLTTSSEQNIQGNVKINKLHVNKANINEIITTNKIMNMDLDYILKDTVGSNMDYNFFGQKHFQGNINVNNLKIKNTINNEPIESIERWLSQIDGNLEFPNTVQFLEDMNIANITFSGNFNDIPADDFGQCWLLNEINQKFSAPQTIVEMTTDDLIISGTLNGYYMEDLVNKTYSINNPETIHNVVFEGNVTMSAPLITSEKINEINFAEEVVLNQANYPQEIRAPVFCSENVYIEGRIQELKKLNNLDLDLLQNFLNLNISKIAINYAVFENSPKINRFNSYDLKNLRNNVWLVNDDFIVDGSITFAQAQFNNYVIIQGPVNEVDLNMLAQNYFSLSMPQTIMSKIIFDDVVTMENIFNTPKMKLNGPIKDIRRKFTMNFDHFVSNTLTTEENQKITAEWKIFNAVVLGDLNNVLINGFRLVDDILRIDVPISNITASKHIMGSITINDLFCPPKSRVNTIDIVDWFSKTVFLQDNYTIQGTTTIDSSFFYSNIKVFGTVNNFTFDENNLLLRNKEQEIYGNVYIVTKYPDKQQIFPLTFENVYTNYINEINVKNFFNNLVESNEISIDGKLIFKQPFVTKYLNGRGYIYNLDTNEFFTKLNSNTEMQNVENKLNILQNTSTLIKQNYKERKVYLSHFEEKQIIAGFIRKIISLTLLLDSGPVDIIAVLSGIESLHLTFYKWDVYKQIFILDNHDISWYSNGQIMVDIFSLSFQEAEFLVTETSEKGVYYQNVIISSTKGFQKMFQLESASSRKIASIELNGEPCFIMYSKYNPQISTFCLEKINNTLELIEREELNVGLAKQIIALEQNYVITLLSQSVEIWCPNTVDIPYQVISVQNAIHITTSNFQDVTYLAVCTKGSDNSLHYGSVEIYSKSMNYSSFEYMQSIEVAIPMQAEFLAIPESSDLILYILSNNPAQPLLIFEYHGIVGFEQRGKSSAAPMGNAINVVTLKSSKQHLLSVISNSGATFIESVVVNI